jgi:hypothetical protein
MRLRAEFNNQPGGVNRILNFISLSNEECFSTRAATPANNVTRRTTRGGKKIEQAPSDSNQPVPRAVVGRDEISLEITIAACGQFVLSVRFPLA